MARFPNAFSVPVRTFFFFSLKVLFSLPSRVLVMQHLFKEPVQKKIWGHWCWAIQSALNDASLACFSLFLENVAKPGWFTPFPQLFGSSRFNKLLCHHVLVTVMSATRRADVHTCARTTVLWGPWCRVTGTWHVAWHWLEGASQVQRCWSMLPTILER